MSVEKSRETSVFEVLDRVLDKGIVIDAWVRVSLVGIDLITVQARVVVASIETYQQTADALALVTGAAAPHIDINPRAVKRTTNGQPLSIPPRAA